MAGQLLRPVAGDGLLARFGSLIMLCAASPDHQPQIAELLDLVGGVAERGGDGRRVSRRLAGLLLSEEEDSVEYPSLVVLGPLDDGLAVFVHGAATVEVTGGDGPERLDGAQTVTWVDRRVRGPITGVRAMLGGAAGEPDRWCRLYGGIVRAGGFVWTAADNDEDSATAERATLRPQPPSWDGEPEAGAAPRLSSVGARPTGPPARVSRSTSTGSHPILGAHAAVEAPAQPEAVPAETVFVETVLVEAVPAEALPAETLPTGNLPTGNLPAGTVIAGTVPAEALSGEALPAAAPEAAPRLTLLRDPAPADLVTGCLCENGHFNAVTDEVCRECAAGLEQPPAHTVTGPRPLLGMLAVDGGPRLPIDGPYVVGRDPRIDADVDAGLAKPLRLTDIDGRIAPVHARVEPHDWEIHVIDLGTPGGTHYCAPDATDWSRVMPNVPTPVALGGKVLFGRTGVRLERV